MSRHGRITARTWLLPVLVVCVSSALSGMAPAARQAWPPRGDVAVPEPDHCRGGVRPDIDPTAVAEIEPEG